MILSFTNSLFGNFIPPHYYTQSGEFDISSCQPDPIVIDMMCVARFYAFSSPDEQPLPNASITINGHTYITNASGYVDIPGLVEGTTYPYTVTATGYNTVTSSILFNTCRGFTVAMSQITCDVTFYVYTGGGAVVETPVAGATITLYKDSVLFNTYTSGGDGKVTASSIPFGSYSYTVVSPSPYGGASGTFFIPDPDTGGCPAQISIHVDSY